MFKRRQRRGPLRIVLDALWPRGGWARAASYLSLRLRRLPAPPARVARGAAAGVFVCFTPFFGLHFLLGALLAWLIRGNIVAALLGTVVGNPLTFPLIAATSIQLGEVILHTETPVPLGDVLKTFSGAFGQLVDNGVSLLTGGVAEWDRLDVFFEGVFLPYAVGGLIPGILASALAYAVTLPAVAAYQRRRANRAAALARQRMKADSAP